HTAARGPPRVFFRGRLVSVVGRRYEAKRMQEVVRRPHPRPLQNQTDQFDSMVQGLRDSADLLERLGRDVAVRSILVDVPADLTGASVRTAARATAFRLLAIGRGYLYRHVPRRYGGAGQAPDPLKSAIIAEEFRRARAPFEIVGQGPSMLVPTLLEHGTEAQKDRFIRDTLLGTVRWCQGYSEPGAGSDLASLRTRAVLDGGHWVVNGQKIWTSNAQDAEWMFALVRTEPEKPKHDGLSYLLIDMKTPGIEVRPLRQMTGDADFNEVFLENARVPEENIVGRRGQGWVVSRSTLKHE